VSAPTGAESGGGTAVAGGIRTESLEDGAVLRVVLATPKANILDMAKMAALQETFRKADADRALKALVIEGEGDHFSFGASVPEHLPGKFERMIPAFHRMFHTLFDTHLPTVAAVRGQCLGGGLELASFCHRVFASSGAKFGQPEIVLGVFAPVASVALAARVGRGAADDLCLSGRTIDAGDAQRIGLADAIADDPGAAALEYARTHLLPRSSASLRMAVRAARTGFARRFLEDLAEVEQLYLEDLMSTADAVEGLRAFVEKRPPVWKNA
jgi:cyclohexa-1,5-dienecarbonyl-CoA hydratase